MNKEWIEERRKVLEERARQAETDVISKVKACDFLTQPEKDRMIKNIKEEIRCEYGCSSYSLFSAINEDKDDTDTSLKKLNFCGKLNLDGAYAAFRRCDSLEMYLDSEPMQFDGDIIITDPCYIIRNDRKRDDWAVCEYAENMGVIGIHNCMVRDTLYGDWGCTVYNTDTKEEMGEFCADAGLVAVFLLDEVLKYNPDFNYHMERTWTTALIKDFSGTVQFVVEYQEGVYEETTKYWKAGDKWEDFTVHVVGHGVNKKTGEPINFKSSQTSM